MEILKDRYTITELSEFLSVTDHALRYYEKEFNLQIPKDERGRRYYTTDLAKLMFQIKNMRDEGLEIKTIKKKFQSEGMINEPSPVYLDTNAYSIIPVNPDYPLPGNFKLFFNDLKDQIICGVSQDVNEAKENINKELNKTKLELGACVENSVRKLESKMEKHFQSVDQSLSNWRKKNKRNAFTRIWKTLFK